MRVGALAPLGVGTVVWRGPEPRLTVVLCATFAMAPGGLELIDPPPPPLGALPGDTGKELIHPDDYVPWKAAADVLLVGYAKNAVASEALPFSIRIGTIDKRGWATAGEATHEVPLSSTYLRDAPKGGSPMRVAPIEVVAPVWFERRTVVGGDFSIFNVAPRDQRLSTIDPGMRLVLEGLVENAPFYDVDLPAWWPTAYLTSDLDDLGQWSPVPFVADTLLADVDAERLTLVWRANLPRPARADMLVLGTADRPLAPEQLQSKLGTARWTTALSMSNEDEDVADEPTGTELPTLLFDESMVDEPTGTEVPSPFDDVFDEPTKPPRAFRDPEATGELDIAKLEALLGSRSFPFAPAPALEARAARPAPSWDALRSGFDDEPSYGGDDTTTGEPSTAPPRGETIPPSSMDEDDMPTLHPPAPEPAPAVGRPVPVDELADAPPPPPPPPPPLPGRDRPVVRRPMTVPVTSDPTALGPPPPPPTPPSRPPPPGPPPLPTARDRLPTAVLDEDLVPKSFGFRSREETSTIDIAALRASAVVPFHEMAEATMSPFAPPVSQVLPFAARAGKTEPPPSAATGQTAAVEVTSFDDAALPFARSAAPVAAPPAAPPPPTAVPSGAPAVRPPNPVGVRPPLPPVPRAPPPSRQKAAPEPQQPTVAAFSLPTLPIAVHGTIRAGLLDGVSLDALLARVEVDERTWRLASRQLAIELAREAEAGERTLARKLEAAIAEARAKAPVVDEDEGPPEDEMDLEAYAAALAEVDEADDPAGAVEALGFEPEEWIALRRRWTRRALQDRNLAMELRNKLAEARRSLRRL